MALAEPISLGGRASLQTVSLATLRASWGKAIASSLASAQSANELIRPLSVTSSNIVPVRLSEKMSRVIVRGVYNQDATAGTHAGKVRLYGIYGSPTQASGSWSWSESAAGLTNEVPQAIRIDNAVTAYTLIADLTNNIRVGNFKYTVPMEVSASVLIDAMGCDYVVALLDTASDLTGGATPAVSVQIGVL